MSRKNKQGSTLVAAIFFALILALTGFTFLGVVRNSGRIETSAQSEIRGLYAAESGLQLATRLLSQKGLPTTNDEVIIAQGAMEVNGLWVKVIAHDTSVNGEPKKRLDSRAYDAPSGGNFVKRVSWLIRGVNGFQYGFFANNVHDNGNKLYCNQDYYGNTYITSKLTGNSSSFNWICENNSQTCAQFHDSVTIYGGTTKDKSKCAFNSSTMDDSTKFNSLAAAISVPNNFKYLADSLLSRTSNVQVLQYKSGGGNTNILEFIGGGQVKFNGTTYAVDGKVIQITGGNVGIFGVVEGNTTVVSAGIITVKDNLIYKGLDTTRTALRLHDSIPLTNQNYLGLVTKSDLVFDNSAKALHVSAAIVAWNEATQGNKTAELDVTNSFSKNGHQVHLTGTVLLGEQSKDFSPLTFVQDRRFLTHSPAGFPDVGLIDNLFKFEVNTWEESSVN
jgi:hypothetical protein